MKNYILEENLQPFVIYGESGCGKTAILAKLTDEVCLCLFKFIIFQKLNIM
jgi:hypothetical protein